MDASSQCREIFETVDNNGVTMAMSKRIRNDEELDAAFERVDKLWGAPIGTPEGDELDEWLGLIHTYESATVDLGQPDPAGAIEYRLDQQGLTESDLVPIVGSRDAVSELLAGKRKITKRQAEALHELLRVPMDLLLQITDAAEPQVTSNDAEPELSRR